MENKTKIAVEFVNDIAKEIYKNGEELKYQTEYATGFDLRSVENVIIPVGGRRLIGLGIKVEILNNNYGIQLRSRSGLANKEGIFVLNGIGTIDNDYRQEIKVILQNQGNKPFQINIGDRICQGIIERVIKAEFTFIDKVEDNNRGGFGSTGKG